MRASPSQSRIVRFGVFEVDLQEGEVRRAGLRQKLGPQPFQVLQALLERPGELVTRDELRERLWADDTFVDYELALKKCVNRIREVLGDSAESPRFIETLPRRGYRFIAPIEQTVGASVAGTPTSFAGDHPIAVIPAREGGIGSTVPSRPHKVGRKPVILAVLVAAIGILILVFVLRLHPFTRTKAQGEEQSIRSLAVLPLENLSGDPSEDYFADGLTDELITVLAQTSDLRVISRTSVMVFKNARKPVAEIARQLNVDGIVEGTVERSGNRVRITAQLIHASTDTHLWADSYERNLRDILSLQDEVARDITNKIEMRLIPAERARVSSFGPVDPQAYQSYLEGRYYWNMRTEEGLNKGIEYFRDAIEKDPQYALAYAGLAQSYITLEGYRIVPAKDAFPLARAAALKALQLNEKLGEAHSALAVVSAEYDTDAVTAEKEFKRAIELNSNYATAHQWYAEEVLSPAGRHKEAIAEMKRALELDPLSRAINTWYGAILYGAGQNDEAISQLQKAIEMDRNLPIAHLWLGRVYVEKKMLKEALAEFQSAATLSRGQPFYLASLGYGYAVSGQSSNAAKIATRLTHLSSHKYVPAYEMAALYGGLRNNDQTLQWLQRACEDGACSGILSRVRYDPAFDSLRSDPRYAALLHRRAIMR
jgi:TolB-like protein/DNA-binding winged helix-turn-helix (wHTH) protein/Tfp pilus assembly protein PilF